MKWPWQQVVQSNRATLTLLSDGKYILGLPREMTAQEAFHISERLRMWLDASEPKRLLIFPFPIDVVDKRR